MNVNKADNIREQDSQQQQSIEKNIHIGVFFDGTNNNKFQVMMGKYFRMNEDKKSLSKTAKDRLDFGVSNDTDRWFVEDSVHSADQYSIPTFIGNGNGNGNGNINGRGNVANFPNEDKENIAKSQDLYRQILKAYKNGDDALNKSGSKGANAQSVETYTNVAILEALYCPFIPEGDDYYPIYIEGAGTDMDLTNKNKVVTRTEGLMMGTGDTGVEVKVQKAIQAIRNICSKYILQLSISKINVHISTYGFSRGATEARMFSFHTKDKKDLFGTIEQNVNSCTLDFVGIFDTVSSVGKRFDDDVVTLNLWGIDHALSVLHLCAMDEFRSKFALTDIENCISSCGTELFMPGCHTDIGGGFSIGLEKGSIKINSQIDVNWPSTIMTEHHFMKLFNPQSDMKQIGVDMLDEMGWIDSGKYIDHVYKASDIDVENAGGAYQTNSILISNLRYTNVEIRKYVKPGYSNIALNLMHAKGKKFFKPVPKAYQVHEENSLLKDCYNEWLGQINVPGRYIAALSDVNYKQLRRDFLHISMTDAMVGGRGLTDNQLVNGPTLKVIPNSLDKLIMRHVFKGTQAGGVTFMDELLFGSPMLT